MKIQIVLPLYKECVGSWRYQAEDKDAVIQSVYIRKSAFKQGEPPPKSILITVNGVEA